MMDLWTLFVENVFGSFWVAVIALAFLQFIILAIGSVSSFSMMIFVLAFLLAMAIGYGNMLIVIPLVFSIIAWTVFQVKRYYEEQ